MAGGPGTGSGSHDGSIDLSQPLVLVLKQLEEETSRSFDDLEAFVDDLMERVLALSPDERFDVAATVVEDRLTEEFGSVDVFAATLGPRAQVFVEFLDKLLDYWLDRAVEQALEVDGEERTACLVLIGAIDLLQTLFEVVRDRNSLPGEQKRRVYSSLIALYARVYEEYKRDSERGVVDLAAIARDTLRGEEVLFDLDEETEGPPVDVAEHSDREVLWMVRDHAAVLVYDRANISLSRGAELADLTQDEFLEHLSSRGVRPRFGPESVEDLFTDPDL